MIPRIIEFDGNFRKMRIDNKACMMIPYQKGMEN
jgi:hypothetical protein